MEEFLKDIKADTLADILWNIAYWFDSELSEIEDLICDNKYSNVEVIEEIQNLRSKLIQSIK